VGNGEGVEMPPQELVEILTRDFLPQEQICGAKTRWEIPGCILVLIMATALARWCALLITFADSACLRTLD
jgi:hypothetical protein